MFGFETEYAITWIKRHKSLSREILMSSFMGAARKCLVHLPDIRGDGMFLANGSRLYIDCGQHPELATPECTNPWDAVRYLKAGEMIIGAAIEKMRSEVKPGTEIFCSMCNVDYVQNTTWGCHESFLHRCNASALSKHIIPHLVSRTIFTGAGGFQPVSAGLRFTLSPRASHIAHVVSSDSTGDRGIYHTKDESLSSSGYHRLHILCGESLRSETSIWLKVGTTALVVAMIDAGLKPCEDLELASPVNALQVVAVDTHCRKRLDLVDGRTATALDIQRHYLNLAEQHKSDPFMPPWAEAVCMRWRQILDLLEVDPAKTNRMLDWTIKQTLYGHHLENRGVPWEKIFAWNKVTDQLQAALHRNRRHGLLHPDFILGPNSPVLEVVAQLTPHIRKNGLSWEELEGFLQLKQEMFEIDTRFGQLGENSVFQSLDRAGMLEHNIDGVDNIEHAKSHPPGTGRARIRGEMVRRLAAKGGGYKCSWQVICDQEKRPILDLSDPFAVGKDAIPVIAEKDAIPVDDVEDAVPVVAEEDTMPARDSSSQHEHQRRLPFAGGSDIDPLLGQFLGIRRRS